MNKEEAIKYLQQLYPNGGHCWLDEQRIEAIGMAINALQEEPVSEDLKEIAWNHADKKCHLDIAVFTSDEVKKEREKMQFTWQDLYDAVMFGAKWQKTKDESTTEDLGEYINKLSKRFPEVSFAKLSRIAVRVAKWQMAQMIKDATDVTVHVDAGGYPYIPQMELYDYDKDVPLAKEGDKYKVVLIKEE